MLFRTTDLDVYLETTRESENMHEKLECGLREINIGKVYLKITAKRLTKQKSDLVRVQVRLDIDSTEPTDYYILFFFLGNGNYN
jgi:hypothetical protein